MKKIFSLIIMVLALACTNMSAQNKSNRMIVVGKDGSRAAYMVENIDSIFFAKMPGTATVNVTAGTLLNDDLLNPRIKATIKKEGACKYFRYAVVTKAVSDEMADEAGVMRYFNSFISERYTEDLNDQVLTEAHVSCGTVNTILAVAYDEYDVACSVARADFEVPGDFTVTVKDVQNISMTLDITPSNEAMRYFVRCEEKKIVDKMSDEQLFNKDKAYFTQMAADYQSSLDDVISWNVQTGSQVDFELSGYKSGTDYVVYIYGIKDSGYEPATGMVRVPIHTVDVEKQDIKFEISTEIVDGYNIDATFHPVNYDGYYSFDVIEVDENMNDADIKSLIEGQWSEAAALYLSFGYSEEEILNELCTSGDFNFLFPKEANKTYVAYAYAVNENAMLCSDVTFVKAKTGDVPHSDNKIDISIVSLTPYNAMVGFTPSIADEEYAVYAAPASEFEGLEGEALMQYLQSMYPMTFMGDMEIEVAPLLPNKEMRVFAYGCVAGSHTTDLFELTFTTPEPVYDENLVGKLVYGKYYDSQEVADIDASYSKFAQEGVVFIPVDLVQTESAILYTAFFGDVDLQGKTDEDLVSWMLYNPDKYATRPGTKYNILRAPYDMEITGVSFVLAEDGSFSKLYKGEKLIIKKDSIGDAQEFVDNYPIPVKGSPAHVKTSVIKSHKNYIKADPSKVIKHNVVTAHADKIKNLKLNK